ncbi:MAG: FtsX-like permease family protein [Candidatus Lokiarchaeota archaeon]|nr:FtsX-like permease family protein [Candidatus Lokiarchaeota archaeon]
MNILYKKAIKDFKKLGWRGYLIVIVVILSLGGGLGLYYSIEAALPMMNLYFDEVNHADYTYQLSETTWINQSQLDGFDNIDEVDKFTGRLFWQTSTKLSGQKDRKYLLLVGLNEAEEDPDVFDYHLLEGEDFNDEEADNISVVVDSLFFNENNLDLEDDIKIGGLYGAKLEIIGTCNAPEFVSMTSNPELIFPLQGSMGVIFMSKTTLKNYIINYLINYNSTVSEDLTPLILSYQTRDYNNIAVTFDGDDEDGNDDVEDYLEKTCQVNIEESEKFEDSYVYDLMKSDVENTGEVMMIIMLFMALMGAIIVYVIFNRYIYSQKQQIGILLGLGYTKKDIIKHFLFNVILISLISIPAGILVGYFFGFMMLNVMFAELTHLSAFEFTFIFLPDIIYIGLAIGFSLTFLSTLFSIRKVTKKIIAELIYEQEEVSKEIKNTKKRKKWPKHMLNRLVFKNLFTNKKRLFFTVAAMTLSLLIVSASQNLMDSIYYNVDRTFGTDGNDIQSNERWDLNVVFQTSSNKSSPDSILNCIKEIDDIEKVKVYTKGLVTAKAKGDNEDQSLILQGIDIANTEFHKFTWEGSKEENSPPKKDDEIVLCSVDAKRLGKELGDKVSIETSTSGEHKFEIVGIHNELIMTPYVTLDAGQDIFYNNTDLIDGVYIILEDNADKDDIVEDIYDLGNVEVIFDADEMRKEILEFVDNFAYVMQIINIYALLVSFFIVFYNSIMNIYDKNHEYGILRSLGYKKRQIFKVIFFENFLQGLFPIFLAIGFTYPLTVQMGQIYAENFPFEVIIGFPAILLITIPPIILYFLGSLIGLRTVYKQNLYEQVQTRFIG